MSLLLAQTLDFVADDVASFSSNDFAKSFDEWSKAGFTVVPQPIVADDPLQHMWITLPDGTYIELISFQKTGTGLSWWVKELARLNESTEV